MVFHHLARGDNRGVLKRVSHVFREFPACVRFRIFGDRSWSLT